MREPFVTSLLSPYVMTLLVYLGYGVAATWLLFQRGKKGLLGLSLLFPWLLFFTEFTAVRIQESFVLYRSYLWMPGIFIAMPLVIERLKFRSAIMLLLLISVICAVFSVNRLKTFSHPLLLWDDAESLVQNRHNLPGVDRIYNNRGTELTKAKLYREAIADFTVAIKLKPNNSYYHMGLGAALYNIDDYTASIAEYSKSIDLDRKNARAYYYRGLSYEKSGLLQKAKSDFVASCQHGWEVACKKMESSTSPAKALDDYLLHP
jgi:tetratricopeptide (TPR) repeat protein